MATPVTIIMDSRERTPLPRIDHVSYGDHLGRLVTNRIIWEKKGLETGDYSVPSRVAGVERKGSPRELWSCVCGKRSRAFRDQLDRMADRYRFAYLFTEFNPFRLSPNLHYPEPLKMGCQMLYECQARGIAWIWSGGYSSRNRTPGAELVCRVLLQAEKIRKSEV